MSHSPVSCRSLILALGCLGLWVALAAPVRALPPCTSQIDVQPAPGAGAQLGCTVATDGSVVATGAHEDSTAAPNAGAIYVLQRGGTLRLTAADAHGGDQLGFGLALEGSTLVAGAPKGDAPGAADAGAVYVFSRPGASWTTGAPQVKLTAPSARRNDQFGQAVALSGDRIAVGAPDRTGSGSLSGAVYVFKRSGASWALEAEIADPDGAPFDSFGFALALDGDTLAVGAPFADQPGRGSVGVVHVFVREGTSWVRRARIVDPAGANGDELGVSVALLGATLASGARRADVLGLIDAGAAFVFVRADASGAAWTQRAKLTATNPGADDLFGSAVAIAGVAGSRIVVGARNHDRGGHNAGAGFVFDSLTEPPLVLLGSPPEPGAALGQAVAAFGDSVVLGAHLADTGGRVDSGALLACPSPLVGPVCPNTTVSKSDGVNSVDRGQTITYRIEVTDAAPGAVVTDDFAAILEAGGWCKGEGCADFRPGPLSDALANGGAAVYRVRGRVRQGAGGSLTNEVCVAAAACPTVCARDTDTVAPVPPPVADLFCTKTGPSSARTGDEVTFNVAVGNQGERTAQSVVLSDLLPAGLAFVRADSPCTAAGTCALGQILSGGVRNLHFTYRVTATGPTTVTNVAKATGSVADPTPGDSTCSASSMIEAPPPPLKADLQVNLAVPAGPLACGAVFTFQATVTNLGPDVAVGTFVEVAAPGISGLPSCVPQGNGLRCTLGDLASGAVQTLSFTGQAPGAAPCGAPPPSIEVHAQTASMTMDPNPVANNSDDKTREVACPPAAPSFGITKSDGQPAVQPGQRLLYTIAVTNTGDCPAAAEVEDLLPPQVEEFRWCRGAGCNPSIPSELHDSIELPPGGSAIYQVGGQASPFASGSISNTASVRFGEEDESSATDIDAIDLPAGVTCLCAGIDGPFVEMSNITYTFVCHNGGPFPQQDNPGHEFLDPLSGSTVPVSTTATSGTADFLPGGIMAWNGAIPVGGQVTITVTVKIQPGTAGNTICNQGQVAFDPNGDGINESAGQTDDPDLPGNADPCCFTVLFNSVPSIPTLAPTGAIFFILLVMIGGLVRLRRR